MSSYIFPSGFKKENLKVSSPSVGRISVRSSLVDAGNLFVLVDVLSLPIRDGSTLNVQNSDFISVFEAIHRHAVVCFGLAANLDTVGLVRGSPKIAFLSSITENKVVQASKSFHSLVGSRMIVFT